MLTKFIPVSNIGIEHQTLVHNTRHWQVVELMGGLACELLMKRRAVDEAERVRLKFALHECYPSVFMQGDEASDLLAQVRALKTRGFSSADIDRGLLADYDTCVH